MVRRKLNRNLKKTTNVSSNNGDNNNRNDNVGSSNKSHPHNDTGSPASSPPYYTLSQVEKGGFLMMLRKYRRVLLIILGWCTAQMYTDTMTVKWNRYISSKNLMEETSLKDDDEKKTAATTTEGGQSSSSPSSWTTSFQNWFNDIIASRPIIKRSGATGSGSKRLPGQLRFDYARLKPKSPVAKILTEQRNDCSLPLKYHYFGAGGLGAELHAYSYSMCWSYQYKWRLYSTHNMYYDQNACANAANSTVSQMNCYFGNLEMTCPGDEITAQQQLASNPDVGGSNPYRLDYWNIWKDKQHDNICQELSKTTGVVDNIEMRSQVIEAMFTAGISPVLLKEAKRQHKLVFSKGVPPPHQLITVHIRWGDKKSEMELVSIQEYVEAIHKIVRHRSLQRVYIFLATEDPAAVQAFQQAMDPSWVLYLDQFYKDMLPFRNNQTQEVAGVARDEGRGNIGLLALGSLLVALEANHFVLTSASNWSRLINELRRSIVKYNGCSNNHNQEGEGGGEGTTQDEDCTTVVDLRKADFWMDLNVDGGGV